MARLQLPPESALSIVKLFEVAKGMAEPDERRLAVGGKLKAALERRARLCDLDQVQVIVTAFDVAVALVGSDSTAWRKAASELARSPALRNCRPLSISRRASCASDSRADSAGGTALRAGRLEARLTVIA